MAMLNPQQELTLQALGINAKSIVILTQPIACLIVYKLQDGLRRLNGLAYTL